MWEFAAKSEKLKKYLALVQAERARFQNFQIQQIVRVENDKTDRLAKMAFGQEANPILELAILRIVEVLVVGIE